MSSADSEPQLEDTSSVDGHENDVDENPKNQDISETEQKNKVEKKLRNKYLNKMLYLLKEFLIMVVVAMAYAAITNDIPKVGKSPAAYRFFSEDPYITDWYRGEISDAISQAKSADIAFVMFYAPWDAECQHARKEFQIVARYMHKQVTFSAVNCWQPGSECKTQYSKVQKWPVLVAYPTHGRGIQYNGPLEAVHIIAFLKKLISPFTKSNAAIVIAEVNAAPFSREYNILYQVAVRLLERDPFQEIAISVHLHPPYYDSGEERVPRVYIRIWNQTLMYNDGDWEVEPILNWIIKHVHQITTWISPSGSKSISLSNYLQPGPALVLFTPRNPLAIHNDFYSMMRETAYEYNNCENNTKITLRQQFIHSERLNKYVQQFRLIEECGWSKFKMKRISSPNLWSNISYCLEKEYRKTENIKENDDSMLNDYGGKNRLCVKLLENFQIDEEELKYKRLSSGNTQYKTSKLCDVPDERSPVNLKKSVDVETCRSFLIAQRYQQLVFSKEIFGRDSNSLDVKGLKCKTNKTLHFIAMDSLYYHHFAEKLGIDLSKSPDKTAMVILDDKMESHYIMNGEVTESNIRNFIHNYTAGSLERALSSLTTVKSEITHSYPNNRQCSFDNAEFCVMDLSATNFRETISQTNKAVIIFYYSKQCSFCNGISYRFLTVAKYFSLMEELQFARIDGDLNLLPWEYTMEVYPTILFIPANQVSESRVFPMDMSITVPNLVGFILANLQSSFKLKAMWVLCEIVKFNPDNMDCISSLRLHISQVIDKTLQEWRTVRKEAKLLMSLKLQHLHDLHFLFLKYPCNITLVENIFDGLKLLEFHPLESTV